MRYFVAIAAVCGLAGLLPRGANATLTNDFVANRTIANATTRNGSLETGTTASWITSTVNGGPTGFQALQSPLTPTDGSWYGVVTNFSTSGQAIGRVTQRDNNIGMNLGDGDILRVTADFARPLSLGFTQVEITPFLTLGTSTATGGQLSTFTLTLPATLEWSAFAHDWVLPNDVTFNGLDVRVNMRGPNVQNTVYTGYLDNLVILQGEVIPEPGAGFLAVLALAILQRITRRRD